MTDHTINFDIGNGQTLIANMTVTATVVGGAPVPKPALPDDVLSVAIAAFDACKTIEQVRAANISATEMLLPYDITIDQAKRWVIAHYAAEDRVSSKPAPTPVPTPLPTPAPTPQPPSTEDVLAQVIAAFEACTTADQVADADNEATVRLRPYDLTTEQVKRWVDAYLAARDRTSPPC